MKFSTCPDCGVEYPEFTSPAAQLGTFCESCGYASSDYLPPGQRHNHDALGVHANCPGCGTLL